MTLGYTVQVVANPGCLVKDLNQIMWLGPLGRVAAGVFCVSLPRTQSGGCVSNRGSYVRSLMRKIALAGVLTLGLIDVASAQTATNSATVTPPGTVTNPGTSCVAPNNFNSAKIINVALDNVIIEITGDCGKTTALRQMLDGIEARGEAALVYDTSGEFVAHYYRPDGRSRCGRLNIGRRKFSLRHSHATDFRPATDDDPRCSRCRMWIEHDNQTQET